MTESTNVFVLGLIKLVANLRHIHEEHIEDYDELLPHVFFGELTRYVVNLYKSALNDQPDNNGWHELDEILEYLENGMSGNDGKIQELIAVSFLENLDSTDNIIRNMEERFGPSMKKELQLIRTSKK